MADTQTYEVGVTLALLNIQSWNDVCNMFEKYATFVKFLLYNLDLLQRCDDCMKSIACLPFGFMAITNKQLELGIWNSVWMYIIHYMLILYEIL
jgi:hypothetical protein